MKERDEQQIFCRMGRRVGTRNSARGLVKAKLALHDCMTKRKKDNQLAHHTTRADRAFFLFFLILSHFYFNNT